MHLDYKNWLYHNVPVIFMAGHQGHFITQCGKGICCYCDNDWSSSENIVRFRFSEIPCAMSTFIISNFFSCDAKGPFPDLKNHKVEFLKGLRDCKVYEKYKGSRIALLRYSQSCHDFALKKQTKPQREYNKNEN